MFSIPTELPQVDGVKCFESHTDTSFRLANSERGKNSIKKPKIQQNYELHH